MDYISPQPIIFCDSSIGFNESESEILREWFKKNLPLQKGVKLRNLSLSLGDLVKDGMGLTRIVFVSNDVVVSFYWIEIGGFWFQTKDSFYDDVTGLSGFSRAGKTGVFLQEELDAFAKAVDEVFDIAMVFVPGGGAVSLFRLYVKYRLEFSALISVLSCFGKLIHRLNFNSIEIKEGKIEKIEFAPTITLGTTIGYVIYRVISGVAKTEDKEADPKLINFRIIDWIKIIFGLFQGNVSESVFMKVFHSFNVALAVGIGSLISSYKTPSSASYKKALMFYLLKSYKSPNEAWAVAKQIAKEIDQHHLYVKKAIEEFSVGIDELTDKMKKNRVASSKKSSYNKLINDIIVLNKFAKGAIVLLEKKRR